MDLCHTCHEAVRLLFPRAKGDKPLHLTIELHLPKLNYNTYNDCWICYHVVEWLESHDQGKLSSWLQAPLAVTYKHLGLSTARFSKSWFKKVVSYMLLVLPEHAVTGDDSDDNDDDDDDDDGDDDNDDDGACIELTCIDKSTYQIMLDAYKPNGSSQIDFALIHEWISMCSTHKVCNDRPDPFLPSRLLKISDDGKTAKLILPEAEFGEPAAVNYQSQRYVTVSHRWGPQQYKKLLACTLHELQQEVVVSALPQVFQDAFIVAARIGVSLVWIDSLCIMQDSGGDDWKTQCQLMHKIYANAFLNISSTGCENNQETMLRKRMRATNSKPQTFRATYSFFPRRRYVVNGQVWIDAIANAPLSARGWVFQERHLARRVLHLGSNVMAWECRGLDALETCPQGLPEKIILNLLAKQDLSQRLAEARSGREAAVSYAYTTWRELVQAYTRCELSYPTDKLLALRGLAAYFGSSLSDEYVAGMWEKGLAIDLAWHIDSCSEDKDAAKRAPSWSWASVDGDVTFPHDLELGKIRIRVSDVHFSRLIDTVAIDASAEDRKAVSLRGYNYEFECQRKGEKIVSFTVGGQVTLPVFGGSPCNKVRIDRSAREFKACKDMAFLVLATSGVSIHGLVLSRLPAHPHAYKRLGSVEIAAVFPFLEINGKKMIGKLPGKWIEYSKPGSWFPWKARVGPFLYSEAAQVVMCSMNDPCRMSDITLH